MNEAKGLYTSQFTQVRTHMMRGSYHRSLFKQCAHKSDLMSGVREGKVKMMGIFSDWIDCVFVPHTTVRILFISMIGFKWVCLDLAGSLLFFLAVFVISLLQQQKIRVKPNRNYSFPHMVVWVPHYGALAQQTNHFPGRKTIVYDGTLSAVFLFVFINVTYIDKKRINN